MISTSRIVIALSALPLAFANYPLMNGTTTSVVYPTGTSSPSPATQTVSVGKNGLVFSPDTVHAKTGDEIVFEFYPKNHAVVQADFNNPCNPSTDEKRIFSDFIPSAVGRANKTFTIKIEDDKKAIWLYCPQNNPKPHCVQGMVMVINPPQYAHNTLEAFRMKAALVTGNATVPLGGASGGKVASPGTPSTPSDAPIPSGSSPTESTGAGALLAANSVLGTMALLAGLAL